MNHALLGILNILFKHKLIIVGSFLVVVIPAMVGWYLQPPVYEASGRLMLAEQPAYLPRARRQRELSDQDINNEIQNILSPPFMATVVTAMPPEVLQTPRSSHRARDLCRGLIVERVPFTTLIEVSYRHGSPDLAATIVNTILDTYPSYQSALYQDPEALVFYENECQQLKAKIEKDEEELERFEAGEDLISLKQQRDQALDMIDMVRSRLRATRTDLAQGAGKIAEIKIQIAGTPTHVTLGQEITPDPETVFLLATLTSLKLQKSELLHTYGDKHPKVLVTASQIQEIELRLPAQREKQALGKKRLGPNIVYQDLARELSEQKVKRGQQMAKVVSLEEQLVELRNEARVLNTKGYDLQRMQASLEEKRMRYQTYQKKAEEARIAAAMDRQGVGNVRITDEAHVPTKALPSGGVVALLLPMLVGAGIGIGAALTLEYMRPTFHSAMDVDRHLDLPVLALIPDFQRQG